MRKSCGMVGIALLLAVGGIASDAEGVLPEWGPRAGLSGDPDQVFVGAQVNVLDIVPSLRLQPNVEIGFGDNITRIAFNGDVLYMLDVALARWTPYVGGELSIQYLNLDIDLPDNFIGDVDDTTTEVGLSILGGVETALAGGTKLLLELKIGVSDTPDVAALVGWMF